MNKCKAIIDVFKKIFETPEFDELYLRKSFSEDYFLYYNGKKLNLEEFILNVKLVKNRIVRIKFNFKNVIASGETVFANYNVFADKKDGTTIMYKVISEIHIKRGVIHYIDELSQRSILKSNYKSTFIIH